MYTVTWKIYGKYVKVNKFETYEAAKGFFNVIMKSAKVTSAELETKG